MAVAIFGSVWLSMTVYEHEKLENGGGNTEKRFSRDVKNDNGHPALARELDFESCGMRWSPCAFP